MARAVGLFDPGRASPQVRRGSAPRR